MAKLNRTMIEKILEAFEKCPNYTKVADMLDLDPRTVKKCVESHEISSSNLKDEVPHPPGTEKYKTIYGRLVKGDSPGAIIAETGIDPLLVQDENKRYHEMNNTDIYALQKEAFLWLYMFKQDIPNIKKWLDLYNHNGVLKNEEFMQVIRILTRLAASKAESNSKMTPRHFKGKLFELRSA